MASMALLLAGCAGGGSTDTDKAPITKPEVKIEGGRLTPEGLWAMGRIGSVASDQNIEIQCTLHRSDRNSAV